MNRNIAAWLSVRPWQAAVIAACCGILLLQGVVLFVVEASAIVGLIVLERGIPQGRWSAILATALVVVTMLVLGQAPWLVLTYIAIVFVLPLASAELLSRTGSLLLVFQLTLVVALLALCVLYAVLPQPALMWQNMLTETFATLSRAGMTVAIDDASIEQTARTMWGALVAMLVVMNLGAVFLARWWQALLHSPGAFGSEFRQLRLGLVLGSVLLLIVLAALVWNVELLDALAWVAMLGLAVQGLATAHRRKADGKMQRGFLVAVYVLLIVPLFTFVMVVMLAMWGLLDNWRRMRMGPLQS